MYQNLWPLWSQDFPKTINWVGSKKIVINHRLGPFNQCLSTFPFTQFKLEREKKEKERRNKERKMKSKRELKIVPKITLINFDTL